MFVEARHVCCRQLLQTRKRILWFPYHISIILLSIIIFSTATLLYFSTIYNKNNSFTFSNKYACQHLEILIPTLHRKSSDGKSVNYIMRTLKAMNDEAFKPNLNFCIVVNIYNPRPSSNISELEHELSIFRPLSKLDIRLSKVEELEFLKQSRLALKNVENTMVEGKYGIVRYNMIVKNVDTLEILNKYYKDRGKKLHGNWLLLMEDDFLWCENSGYHIERALKFVMTNQVSAFRLSFGLNGVLVKIDDFNKYIPWFAKNMGTMPSDYLLADHWTLANDESKKYFGSRAYYVYRFNLMEHIGDISAVGSRKLTFPKCYDPLIESYMLPHEHFNMELCKTADMTPCKGILNSYQSK
jgi:hypothetical protein